LVFASVDLVEVAVIATGEIKGDRQAAFPRRSTTIGLVLATNDFDAVDAYAAQIDRAPIAGRIEDWSLPTYTRDARPLSDYWLPRSTTLERTADEVLRELDQYPEANAYYLAKIYLPRALRQDPAFGGRLLALRRRLEEVRENAAERRTLESLDKILGAIHNERSR
jgi:hypothetical protein